MSQPIGSSAGVTIHYEPNATRWPPQLADGGGLATGHLRLYRDGARLDLRLKVQESGGAWRVAVLDAAYAQPTGVVASIDKRSDGARHFALSHDGFDVSGRVEYDSRAQRWTVVFDATPNHVYDLHSVPPTTPTAQRVYDNGMREGISSGARASLFEISRNAWDNQLRQRQSDRIWGSGGQEAWRKFSK